MQTLQWTKVSLKKNYLRIVMMKNTSKCPLDSLIFVNRLIIWVGFLAELTKPTFLFKSIHQSCG